MSTPYMTWRIWQVRCGLPAWNWPFPMGWLTVSPAGVYAFPPYRNVSDPFLNSLKRVLGQNPIANIVYSWRWYSVCVAIVIWHDKLINYLDPCISEFAILGHQIVARTLLGKQNLLVSHYLLERILDKLYCSIQFSGGHLPNSQKKNYFMQLINKIE